ncbi:uncharacterized protein MELLADRAFT_63426 [Melampsora larici-populina 98AG31]|uniref:CxC1-like cysteine cluster associated with KDZ transposases domain-containing protein n=1 Tax=Melampsora larici-populina (strain 98AG31 / pathotype 3-4-7) TaxID=747676 RepID=F4RML3_MELLP|nr:uncharacterized protein MELLADRAFT_63426 [Melampsora larici-populina 98AG31]EGG06445.1 hypothetical protein MELLADRAFT_63426 [Melampsora larici-populina 98AG31]
MPSLRIINGFNHRKKEPKPTTPIQRQLVRTRQRDLENAEASMAAMDRRLNQRHNEEPQPLGDEIVEDHPMPAHDDVDQPGDEEGEDNQNLDMNRYMNGEVAPQELLNPEDPILAALRREVHLADRLANEKDWFWQYTIMLPTFLRNRLLTSNWGKEANWNEDFRPPCNCAGRTERNVDLVDILCESKS